jgi:putative SOS response-associated peptidase YedK
LFTPPSRIARLLEATLAAGLDPEGKPSWNIGPQRTLFALTEGDEGRVLDRYRWGLLPSWAKDPSMGNKLFNARGETVAEKPSFRSAFARRPCVVPIDGFYEWDRRPATKTPHFFTRADGELLLLAGLHEWWRDPAAGDDGPGVQTVTVITTTPNDDIDGIHDRMPVVLESAEIDAWCSTEPSFKELRLAMLDPAPKGTLVHHVVGASVGNVRNDGPELIEVPPATALF